MRSVSERYMFSSRPIAMTRNLIDDEIRYRLLKKIQANPEVSQRLLAAELGISLGKVNYCIKYLINAGLVKAGSFARSKSKSRYIYALTPAGIEEKEVLVIRFLEQKQRQYNQLEREIIQLKNEVDRNAVNESPIKRNDAGN
jgi:EPS-associated MarR family transcriptional regulator